LCVSGKIGVMKEKKTTVNAPGIGVLSDSSAVSTGRGNGRLEAVLLKTGRGKKKGAVVDWRGQPPDLWKHSMRLDAVQGKDGGSPASSIIVRKGTRREEVGKEWGERPRNWK